MSFIEPSLDIIVTKLEQLKPSDKPFWGSMSAQRMIQHLSDSVKLSCGDHSISLQIPEEKVQWVQNYLKSEGPMPQNFEAIYAKAEKGLRWNNIQSAITELKSEWGNFENHFKINPKAKTLHPYFGELDFELWERMHSKHITHHLEQFGINV